MFASSIPEIIDLVGTRSKYGGEFKREHGKRYIACLIYMYCYCLHPDWIVPLEELVLPNF